MATPFSRAGPTKLYALLLKLRPMQQGTLMPFSGELVHGAWLDWLRSAAPDVATWLHEGNKLRLFTCSSLQFPVPAPRMRNAERENVHLPVDPEKVYTVRITLLLGELFPLFHDVLMNFNRQPGGAGKPPFMRIGKQLFLLEEVVAGADDPSGWTGFTSFAQLAEKAKALRLGRMEPVALEFDSLTSFSRGNQRDKAYGNHHARLPLPHYVFPGLARRWQELAPPELAGMVKRGGIEENCPGGGGIIAAYGLKAPQVEIYK